MSRIHPVFNVVKLELAIPDPIKNRHIPPPPDPILVDGEEEYEIESIIQLSRRYRGWWYLVKWKGYEEYQWVKASDMHHAADLVDQFHREHPDIGKPETIGKIRLSPAAFDSLAFQQIPTYPATADTSNNWRTRPSRPTGP